MTMIRSLRALLLATSLAAVGCNRPSFGEVNGTVTIDGKPAEGLVVYFVPDLAEGSDGPTSWGSTDATGRYTLDCMNRNQPGALIGRHRVVCEEPERLLAGKKSRVPERYRSPATTPLRFEVREGKQTIDLSLTSAP
jgi:hypothetical protein